MITVAALMPTIASHAQFRPIAEKCFAQQKFPADWKVYLQVDEDETDSLGKKLNRLCSACVVQNFDYIVLWDDDDWYAPNRIYRQIVPLLLDDDFLVSGTSQVYYRDNFETWLYKGSPAVWLYGLAFRTSFWQEHLFEDISQGVDTKWLKNIPVGKRFDVNDPALSVATIHSANTCRKNTAGPHWSRVLNISEE